MKIWRIRYVKGWGTRGPRQNYDVFCATKPSKFRALALINNREPWPDAKMSWFNPENSGLLTISEVEVMS